MNWAYWSDSLNAMSDNLKGAMGELEAANAQLKRDYALVRSMEKQRRDFFAAASHELKTPITILKGQIESMIYGIGKYKNVRQALPETLSEIERMEGLGQGNPLHIQDGMGRLIRKPGDFGGGRAAPFRADRTCPGCGAEKDSMVPKN